MGVKVVMTTNLKKNPTEGKGVVCKSWQARVPHFWDEARAFLTDSEVLTIAEDALKLIPNVQG